uniref:HMG box domain-containing protein n=1 Tax=Rhodosorus marinus TaxID=101924 RepID=A0A7S0G173_9RHOD|mmetsp:Transcript_19023/g.27558  ORF Transcript_19023/g.27558 Transcript_19023/m.27558 type:complete len:341 (+) Transcript_19023:3-1025(+)
MVVSEFSAAAHNLTASAQRLSSAIGMIEEGGNMQIPMIAPVNYHAQHQQPQVISSVPPPIQNQVQPQPRAVAAKPGRKAPQRAPKKENVKAPGKGQTAKVSPTTKPIKPDAPGLPTATKQPGSVKAEQKISPTTARTDRGGKVGVTGKADTAPEPDSKSQKRNASSFDAYRQFQFGTAKLKGESFKLVDKIREIGVDWRNLGDEEKEKFKQVAEMGPEEQRRALKVLVEARVAELETEAAGQSKGAAKAAPQNGTLPNSTAKDGKTPAGKGKQSETETTKDTTKDATVKDTAEADQEGSERKRGRKRREMTRRSTSAAPAPVEELDTKGKKDKRRKKKEK